MCLPTPSPDILENNLTDFLNRWKYISYKNISVLSVKALKEIENLRVHIKKCCLSGLPKGCGSERNEKMHKCVRQALTRGRMGVFLAVSLISSFLYTWNEKQKHSKDSSDGNVFRPLISRKSELLGRPITDETFGIGVSENRPLFLDSLSNIHIKNVKLLPVGSRLICYNSSDSEDECESNPLLFNSVAYKDLLIRANNIFILKEKTQSFGSSLPSMTSFIPPDIPLFVALCFSSSASRELMTTKHLAIKLSHIHHQCICL